ncbi:unnamed protein product [Bubo scandiacus]
MPEDSDSSWTYITDSEVSSSSRVSLSSLREDLPNSITSSEAISSAEVCLAPSSNTSLTSIAASNVGSSSLASLLALVDGADMAHGSSIQPVLEHRRAGPEEQPGTHMCMGVYNPSPSGQAPLQSERDPWGHSGQGSERPSISSRDMGPPEQPLEKSGPVEEADHSLRGQSSSSEDVGTPELPSDCTAAHNMLPVRGHPQLCHCLQTPPPMPGPSDPHLEERITALAGCSRASQADEDLQNQLLSSWLEQLPDNAGHVYMELAVELPGALQSRGQRGAETGEGSTQDGDSSRSLCPECSKSLRHSLTGSEGSQSWAPYEAAALRAGSTPSFSWEGWASGLQDVSSCCSSSSVSLWHITAMSVMCWAMSWFTSPAALLAAFGFLQFLLLVVFKCLTLAVAKPQVSRGSRAQWGMNVPFRPYQEQQLSQEACFF